MKKIMTYYNLKLHLSNSRFCTSSTKNKQYNYFKNLNESEFLMFEKIHRT